MMKWLSNTRKDEKNVWIGFHSTYAGAVSNHREWLKDKIIGRLQESTTYTVEQLEDMGMVGVYMEVPDEQGVDG